MNRAVKDSQLSGNGIEYKIVVREIASKEAVYRETYIADNRKQAEQRCGLIWNNPYAGMPDRYRLYLYEPGNRRAITTIG